MKPLTRHDNETCDESTKHLIYTAQAIDLTVLVENYEMSTGHSRRENIGSRWIFSISLWSPTAIRGPTTYPPSPNYDFSGYFNISPAP
ncbi:hypothetical protein TNCT_636411 [Trichonephila clavata]|uniref:Uncharacterized protein n=1 Tax=Trichonephila clavata TaxID=2740835 RepID=A0A8X6F069_TRICU|nr:hypothetical protein TNCT_636411 [Trichonephila clavata]